MFIIRLLPVYGTRNGRKQVQDARFDKYLTGVKKSFYWLTKTLAHKKGYRESENKFAMLKKFIRSKLS